MARLPVAGRVKTRLARGVGAVEAVRRYRALLAASVRACTDPRWRLVLAVTPAASTPAAYWRRLAPQADIIAQAPCGLGRRMAALLQRAGPAPAAVIGSDILDLDASAIAASFAALSGHDAVLSPAEDGGFWFCAVRGVTTRFAGRGDGAFAGITWSRPDTGARTVKSMELAGFRVGRGPPRADLDEAPPPRSLHIVGDLDVEGVQIGAHRGDRRSDHDRDPHGNHRVFDRRRSGSVTQE